jgi:hypothetical protein
MCVIIIIVNNSPPTVTVVSNDQVIALLVHIYGLYACLMCCVFQAGSAVFVVSLCQFAGQDLAPHAG